MSLALPKGAVRETVSLSPAPGKSADAVLNDFRSLLADFQVKSPEAYARAEVHDFVIQVYGDGLISGSVTLRQIAGHLGVEPEVAADVMSSPYGWTGATVRNLLSAMGRDVPNGLAEKIALLG